MRSINKIFKALILLFFWSIPNIFTGVDLTELVDTYNPLKAEFKHLSPVHGALWWESGLLERYHDFGNNDATIQLLHQFFHTVNGIFNITLNKSYGAAHLTPASIGRIIGTLEKIRLDEKSADSEKIAAELKTSIDNDDDIKKSLATLDAQHKAFLTSYQTKELALKAILKAGKKTKSPLKLWLDYKAKQSEKQQHLESGEKGFQKDKGAAEKKLLQIRSQFKDEASARELYAKTKRTISFDKWYSKIKTSEKELANLASTSFDTWKKKQKEALITINEEIKKLLLDEKSATAVAEHDKLDAEIHGLAYQISRHDAARARAGLAQIPQQLTRAIVQSLPGAQQQYFPFTPYMFLLGFVYRSADSRQALADYFKGLQSTLPTEIFMAPLATDWLTKKFSAADIEQTKKALHAAGSDIVKLSELYESLVITIMKKRRAGMPNNIQYKDALFEGVAFSDCQESLLRNLMNLLAFDDSGRFSIETLSKKISSDAIQEQIKHFYSNNPLDADVTKLTTHNAWANVAEHQPWVAYNRKLLDGTNETVEAPLNTQGFMYCAGVDGAPIFGKEPLEKLFNIGHPPKVCTIEVFGDDFKLIVNKERDQQSTYIIVNPVKYHVFEAQPSIKNIIIFFNQMLGLKLYDNIATEFVGKNFNTTYLPELLNRFDWNCNIPSDIDKNDYTAKKINLICELEKATQFKVTLNQRHGKFTLIRLHDETTKLFDSLFKKIQKKPLFLLAESSVDDVTRIGLLNLFSGQIFTNITKALHQCDHRYLLLRTFLYYMIDTKQDSQKFDIITYIIEQQETHFFALLEKLIYSFQITQDSYYLSQIIKAFVKMPLISDTKNPFNRIFNQVFQQLDPYKKLLIYATLVKKNQAYEVAEKAAFMGLKSPDAIVRQAAWDLYGELLEKGQAYQAIEKAALEGTKSPDAVQHRSALDLYTQLVEKGRSYEGAEEAANAGFKNPNPQIQRAALTLYKNLIDKGRAYRVAEIAATWQVKQSDTEAYLSGLDLYEHLVQRGHAYKKAIKAAAKGLTIPDIIVQIAAIGLYCQLVEKDQAYKEAEKAAAEGLLEASSSISESVLSLYEMLFRKGHGFAQAKKVLAVLPAEKEESKKALQALLIKYRPKKKKVPAQVAQPAT